MSNFYGDTNFGLEVISTASFVDEDCKVTVQVIRLNPEALHQYQMAKLDELDGHSYGIVAWRQQVYTLLGASQGHGHSVYVDRVLAEICTVVTMERVGGTP